MSRYSQRPENALKRANEFLEVGRPGRALDTLYEVFRNKKWAYNWSESVLEPIMFKYLDLCVDLKKSHIAKEGLFQYRNMFQSVNVGSLENVIRGYLRSAEERTEAAREQSQQAVVDIDDLDNLATPESILLSAVSGEDAQDRSDRTILTPWVKFLWESYCQCLELLRTNAHVETLYHDIAKMAYQFCLKYNRKTEFRKLCDKLRKHLEDIAKLPAQTVNVSLSNPETQQYNLETRLYQLDYAIQMELWQEAYKATEDIHNLMTLAKKSPVPKTMANYYQKLAMVFWKAGYNLFHAAALLKLFQLSKEMKKNITAEELQRMASRVLLATLAVPLPSAHPEFDRFIETDKSPYEKAQKLAVLLSLPAPPTRISLLKEVVRHNVIQLASEDLRNLYFWLEVDFQPLELCKRVESVTESLIGSGSELEGYVVPVREVTLARLIRQLSQIYETIEYKRLLELASYCKPFHMERILVDLVRHNDMQIRIDHGKGCIQFGMDLSESQREDKPEGPTLQTMPSEQIRTYLINVYKVLSKSANIINPEANMDEHKKVHQSLIRYHHESKDNEHQRILARHKIIEDRKEYLERLNTVREEEEARRAEEIARAAALAELRRLEAEREEREKRRQESEMQAIKDRNFKEKMQQISQTAHGQKVLKKLNEDALKNMDADEIAAKEAEELAKERAELVQKLKNRRKQMDYFERAKRIEEIPLLDQAWKEKQVHDKKFWEHQEAERIQLAIQERKLAEQNRERLARMKPDMDIFLNELKARRTVEFQTKLEVFEEELVVIRKERLKKRKEERKAALIKQREEEKRRKEEEEKQRREEEERKRKEEERKKKEEEERAANLARKEQLERQAEIQRKKEEEIQRKLEEKDKTLSSSTTTTSSWRAADKNKEDSKIFGARDKDKRGDGFGRNRDDAPPSERRPVFNRGNDERKGGVFGARDGGERSSWSRGGGSSSGGAFDKSFKDGSREGGRSAFDRDTPRKREIPSSNNDQGNWRTSRVNDSDDKRKAK
ncbi:eukaryotic translation initiation factor 3 subunit A isoform X2 [Daktulosphaira vitifoliae]|uniref:eukaryotic translation initiation factor 3 subunit A isoform X2 n=1 Tax=Daktulosphaira vitifoliae TaxID=58002 RepID=UPI0021AA88C8|nr:eukaryotic translation initiation factor 3 subunit A isoform X2 [Daktulosphaira vitifoliae]